MRYRKESLSKFLVLWYAISTTWWFPCNSAASPNFSQQAWSSKARAASRAIYNNQIKRATLNYQRKRAKKILYFEKFSSSLLYSSILRHYLRKRRHLKIPQYFHTLGQDQIEFSHPWQSGEPPRGSPSSVGRRWWTVPPVWHSWPCGAPEIQISH